MEGVDNMSCNICGNNLPFCSKNDCDVCEDCATNITTNDDWCVGCDEKDECDLYNTYS